MAYVSGGTTASRVTQSEIPACDHWEIWLFRNNVYVSPYGAAGNTSAHWGTIDGSSEAVVEEKLKKAQAFDKAWTRFAGAGYNPAMDLNAENPLGPICITSQPSPSAQQRRQQADQMSETLQTLENAAQAVWATEPGPNEELRGYLETLDAMQQTQARIFQMLDSHIVNLVMLDDEMQQLNRQEVSARQLANQLSAIRSSAATTSFPPTAQISWAAQQHYAGGVIRVSQSWTADPDGKGFLIDSTLIKGYPFNQNQTIQMNIRLSNLKLIQPPQRGYNATGWGSFFVDLSSPLASTDTYDNSSVELFFSTEADAMSAYRYLLAAEPK